jgi:hypothetical protein
MGLVNMDGNLGTISRSTRRNPDTNGSVALDLGRSTLDFPAIPECDDGHHRRLDGITVAQWSGESS